MKHTSVWSARHWLGRLFWLVFLSSLVGACIHPFKGTSVVKGVVQDSTGRPLPGFTVSFETGGGGGGLAPPQKATELYKVVTDQAGAFQQTLSWHDDINRYSIFTLRPLNWTTLLDNEVVS